MRIQSGILNKNFWHNSFFPWRSLYGTLKLALFFVSLNCTHNAKALILLSFSLAREITLILRVPYNDRQGKNKLCQKFWFKIPDWILIHYVSLNCTHNAKAPILLSFSLAREITLILRVPYNDRQGKNFI